MRRASRASLALPGRQEELLRAVVALGKPVVLVLINGRPLAIEWAAANVPAILEAWEPGSEGGSAIADALFGDVNPGGKLPASFPREGQTPIYYAHNLTHQPESSERYRSRYWDGPSQPVYPFGHGLSYTTFAYTNLRLAAPSVKIGQPATVTVDVQNTGAVAGDEVVQLYVHQRYGSDSRPVRELKGFERVTLAPGETKTVRFTLGPDELRYWSTAKRPVAAGRGALRRLGGRRLDRHDSRRATGRAVVKGGSTCKDSRRSSSCSLDWARSSYSRSSPAPLRKRHRLARGSPLASWRASSRTVSPRSRASPTRRHPQASCAGARRGRSPRGRVSARRPPTPTTACRSRFRATPPLSARRRTRIACT